MRFPFELPPGLVSDDTPFSSRGYWADANKVRFVEGRPETIGGWTSANATTLTGACRTIHSWTDNTGTINQAFGTHSNLYVLKNGTVSDITPAGLSAGLEDAIERTGYGQMGYGEGPYGGGPLLRVYPRTWSMDTYGEWLIANPRGLGVYYWQNDATAVATAVPNAPSYANCILVTPQRQALALGTTEVVSGEFNTMCIRGSDLQDITEWDVEVGENSFEHILPGGGEIISGKMVGSYVGVWTDTTLFLGQYLGYADQRYRFDPIASDCGLAGPNAVTVSDGIAYWLTNDLQFYAWNPAVGVQALPCPISEDFRDNIDTMQIAKVVAAQVSEFGEIWWHYPDSRDGDENSRYVTFNPKDGTWTRGTMDRPAFVDSGPQRYPMGVDASGQIYLHENGNDANGSNLSWSITSGGVYFDEAENRVLVRGMWPDIKDQQGSVTMTLYSRDYPQSTAVTEKNVTLTVGKEKADFMCEGRVFTVAFAGNADPSFMRLGKPNFEVKASGRF